MTVKNSAILLIVLGVIDLLAVPLIVNSELDPPAFVVPLTVLVGLASFAAAYGLLKGLSWARPTGIASRAVDILGSLPPLFMGLPASQVVGTLIVVILSALSIYMLVKIPGAQAKPA